MNRYESINLKLMLKLANSFYQVMSHTTRRYYLIFLRSLSRIEKRFIILLYVRIKSILVFKISKLTLLEYFEMTKRSSCLQKANKFNLKDYYQY